MAGAKVVADHRPPDRPPLKVTKGERLTIGDLDTTWPAFRWCVNGDGIGGWIPDRHLRPEGGGSTVVAAASYDTTELSADVGDILTVIETDAENGWLWCSDRTGNTGWIPIRSVVLL